MDPFITTIVSLLVFLATSLHAKRINVEAEPSHPAAPGHQDLSSPPSMYTLRG